MVRLPLPSTRSLLSARFQTIRTANARGRMSSHLSTAMCQTRRVATTTANVPIDRSRHNGGERALDASHASPSSSSSSSPRSMNTQPTPSPSHSQGNGSIARITSWYLRFCRLQPLIAVAATSFVLWGLGDATAQTMERWLAARAKVQMLQQQIHAPVKCNDGVAGQHHNNQHHHQTKALSADDGFDLRRLWATIVFGTVVAGLGGHYWYRFLDHVVRARLGMTEGSARFIAAKLAMECLVWHPVGLSAFWTIQGVYAEGKRFATVREELKTDLLPALAVEVGLWTPVDIINFRYTPVHLQVIVVNFVSFFEAVILSYLHSEVLARPQEASK